MCLWNAPSRVSHLRVPRSLRSRALSTSGWLGLLSLRQERCLFKMQDYVSARQCAELLRQAGTAWDWAELQRG